MAPIHETDHAEKRWESAEWSEYELWEKVEQRSRRKRGLWILATTVVFLLLAAVPVAREKTPKWRTLLEARRLGQRVNAIKREAITLQSRLAIELVSPQEYEVKRVESCERGSAALASHSKERIEVAGVRFLTPAEGERLGIAGVTDRYCFSPWEPPTRSPGSEAVPTAVFALVPERDLPASDLTGVAADARIDRVSLLWVEGDFGEIRFE